MGLFSKLKDYNSELEKILDNKYFSSSIKSLLFSMIYKLEISYVDFKEVKRCVRSKEDFLNEIIELSNQIKYEQNPKILIESKILLLCRKEDSNESSKI